MSEIATAWRAFEALVAQIQRQLAPSATVVEDERILGSSGVTRRVDVTVRQSVSAYSILIAIDCKRHRRKVDVGYVAAFADQAKDVRANRAVLISNTGFTKGAVAIAKVHDMDLQTLVEAQETDWVAQFGPGAWTSLIGVTALGVQGIATGLAGTQIPITLDTPAYDAGGVQAETVGELFWNWWKNLGRDRKVGEMRFQALATPGQVFVKVGERLEPVLQFDVTGFLEAKRWIVPLRMDHGHILLQHSGEAAYQEFTTASFQWRQIMETQPGTSVSPIEYEQMLEESKMDIDLAKANRFLRVVLQSKPN
jgi:hypothetical protein